MAHNKSISSEEIVVLAIVLDDVFFLAELHRKRGVDLASNPHLRKVLLSQSQSHKFPTIEPDETHPLSGSQLHDIYRMSTPLMTSTNAHPAMVLYAKHLACKEVSEADGRHGGGSGPTLKVAPDLPLIATI